jgi:hypothetical protein
MNSHISSRSGAYSGIARVNWGVVLARATTLAASRGRQPHEVSRQDWEEAAASITGQIEVRSSAPTPAPAENVDSGVASPAFIGSKTFVASGEDVDDPESSDRERLFSQGVADGELSPETRKQAG